MAKIFCISMRWESNLSINHRYTRGDRPRLRPEVAAWQEELAWETKSAMAFQGIEWPSDCVLIVDIQMRFPLDGQKRDPDNYLKSALDALEAGTGVDDSRFIPFIREVRRVDPAEEEPGFSFKVYPTHFAGHGVTGRIEQRPFPDGDMVIVLDDDLPQELAGTRVTINLGVIYHDDTNS